MHNLLKLGYKHLGFTKNFETRQPRYTFRIDLKQDMEDIEKHFSKTTMQRINKSLKLATEVEIGSEKDLKEFYQLMMLTEDRKDFVSYPFEYYETLYHLFKKTDDVFLFLGKVNLEKMMNILENDLKEVNDEYEKEKEKTSKSAKNKQKELLRRKDKLVSDLEKYIDGKVQIKEDSVVLTIDDGNSTTYSLAQPILEKYKINATSFIVTSWDNNPLSHRSEYLEVHSHTHNMHITGKCSGGQGGLFKCISYEDGIADLKKTREALYNTTYLAYPFGEYTSSSIQMLKDAGFTMAFTTVYGNATVGMDKYLIPRKYVYNEYSLNTFKNMIK